MIRLGAASRERDGGIVSVGLSGRISGGGQDQKGDGENCGGSSHFYFVPPAQLAVAQTAASTRSRRFSTVTLRKPLEWKVRVDGS